MQYTRTFVPCSPFQASLTCVAKNRIGFPQKSNSSPSPSPSPSPFSTQNSLSSFPQEIPPYPFPASRAAMANMIMASSKPLISLSPSSLASQPKLQIPQFSLPKIPALTKTQLLSPSTFKLLSPSSFKPLSLFAATSLAFAPHSLAEAMEKAALFDFNLTLPIIMVEFLLLMVALDKIYYTPLGNFMDERDKAIKEKLNSVKDTSEEVKQLEEQAAAVMKAARAEISAALNKMKKETQEEVEQKLAEGRKKIEAELQEALGNLEKQKEDTIRALDSQIAALSDEIVKKVLPVQ